MLVQKANPTQPIRKISRFVVSKVSGPPIHSNVANQQQVVDASRSQLQQTEELKISQNIFSHHTDDLHGKRFYLNDKNSVKTNYTTMKIRTFL